MIPYPILPDTDVCQLVEVATISEELAARLLELAKIFYDGRVGLSIISGYRSPEHQLALRAEGRPAADPDLSTHCSCPATGADLWPDVAPTGDVKGELGRAAYLARLRWGGGSPVDPQTGIPSDWNHVDLGPRPRPS